MYKIRAYHDPSQTLQLVFSDEFEMDGRSFYPGDDPYWWVFFSSFFQDLFQLETDHNVGKQWTCIIGRQSQSLISRNRQNKRTD
jgi:hypothetical protein